MDTLISPRRRTLVAALGAGALLAGCSDGLLAGLSRRPLASFAGPSMGTTWNAKLAGTLAEGIASRAEGAIASALAGVVERMSAHLATSELGRFNRHASPEPFAVSRETLEVFVLARTVSEQTAGAFDVTVAPAVDAWLRTRGPEPPALDARPGFPRGPHRLPPHRHRPAGRHAREVARRRARGPLRNRQGLRGGSRRALAGAARQHGPPARGRRRGARQGHQRRGPTAHRHRAPGPRAARGAARRAARRPLDGHLRRLPHLLRARRPALLPRDRSRHPRAGPRRPRLGERRISRCVRRSPH